MSASPIRAAKPRSLRFCPRCRTRQPWYRSPRAYPHRPVKACTMCGTATLAKAPQKARPKRKGKRASLAREADRLWALLVKRPGRCEDCGSVKYLQAAHGFSRRYRGTRWVILNGFCLCRGCHFKHGLDPLGWTAFLKQRWGVPVYEELERLARTVSKPDHAAIVAKLRAELA